MVTPEPKNETERLAFLLDTQLFNNQSDVVFDELAELAAKICDTPIASIMLVGETTVCLKARIGIDAETVERSEAFCSQTILSPEQIFEIHDTRRHEHWCKSRLVTEAPHIRFYAGFPLTTRDGFSVGTLCVASTEPKCLFEWQRDALRVLAHQVTAQIEMRVMLRKHIEYENALEQYRIELENTIKKLS